MMASANAGKAFTAFLLLLAFTSAACQDFATASANAQANSGFNTNWWSGGSVGSQQALAQANAQIFVQGCTPGIRSAILKVQATAQASGNGQAFAKAVASVEIVGPGIAYCYSNSVAQARSVATAQWAQNNGFQWSG